MRMHLTKGPRGIHADLSSAVTATITEHILRDVASGEARYWTIRLRADASFAGLCDLSEMQADQSADIGFMLVRRFWEFEIRPGVYGDCERFEMVL